MNIEKKAPLPLAVSLRFSRIIYSPKSLPFQQRFLAAEKPEVAEWQI